MNLHTSSNLHSFPIIVMMTLPPPSQQLVATIITVCLVNSLLDFLVVLAPTVDRARAVDGQLPGDVWY